MFEDVPMRTNILKGFGYLWLATAGLMLTGCWANPSLVKIQSDPPGARVWYEGQDLGVTPVSTVLACPLQTQYVRLELPEQPTHDVPLKKRPIRYYVPWYAIVAVGFFTFTTTWRSEACAPDDFTVVMVNGQVRTPSTQAEAEARAAQEQWTKKPNQENRAP
jgi:PEGA domain-containing protein